ncbi:hypothetical protein BaRGS_00007085, partial [Batillaria attramentaria]
LSEPCRVGLAPLVVQAAVFAGADRPTEFDRRGVSSARNNASQKTKACLLPDGGLTTDLARDVRGENQTALLSFLFDKYEKSVRPVCQQDEPIQVEVGLAVRQIIELDEPKQILYLNAWIRLRWYDCQLRWNVGDFGNIGNLIMSYGKVWTPDITLYDNAEGEMPGLKDYRVNIYSDGTVSYNFPTVIAVLCKIDVTYFPFDTQRCPLQFGSWAHHGLELNVTNRSDAGDISSFVANSEFDITSIPLERHVIVYGCCPEPYPDVTFYVIMRRKPMFYILNLLFPCILITTVAMLGFMLPPEAGEKISLEITVLLSLAVFLLVVSETLPPTSETFPYIGVYFACAMLLVSLSTVLTVLVLNIHHTEYKPLPRWMRCVFLDNLARFVCFNDVSVHPHKDHHVDVPLHNGHAQTFDKDSCVCQDKGMADSCTVGNRQLSALGEERSMPGDLSQQFAPLVHILQDQLRLMKKAEARKELKLRHDHQNNEWKKMAIVLDRLFLVLFGLISTITSLVILVPISNQ